MSNELQTQDNNGQNSKKCGIAIRNNNLLPFLKNATPKEEYDKSNCIFDLVKYGGVEEKTLRLELYKVLYELNQSVHEQKQLNQNMIKIIIDKMFTEYNGVTLPIFYRAIKNGMNGIYGKVFALDVPTVINWITQYYDSEEYDNRLSQLREKHEENKHNELNKMVNSDIADLMREALERTKPKPREYQPRQEHLNQFKQAITLYDHDELEKAISDWEKRQRPQYLELLKAEKLRRFELRG